MAAARKRRVWLIVLAALVLLVAAGPTLLGSIGPLRDAALAAALPPEAGRLSVEGASIGWVGPLALEGVELCDARGELIAKIQRVELSEGLAGLAQTGKPVAVRVVAPMIDVVLSPDGRTNLTTLIEELERRERGESGVGDGGAQRDKRPLSVEVTAARVRLTDVATGQRWGVDSLEAKIDGINQGADALRVDASGEVSALDADSQPVGAPGGFKARVGSAEGGGRLARLEAQSLPLSIAGALARRSDPSATVDGTMNLRGEATWRSPDDAPPTDDPLRELLAGRVAASGSVGLAGLTYCGRATGGRPLQLDAIEAPFRFSSEGDRLRLDRFEARLPVGVLRAVGSIALDEADAWRAGAALLPSDLRVDGDIDLARLAAIAPEVLRLQEGVRIDGGRVVTQLVGSPGQGGPRLSGTLAVEGLSGQSNGRRVAWSEPINAGFGVDQRVDRQGLAAWRLEAFRCDSSFLEATAGGDANRLTGELRFDLDRLSQELTQFVDLSGARLAGTGDARLDLRPSPAGDRWRLVAEGKLQQLFIGLAERPIASEPRLDFNAQIDGVSDGSAPPTGALQVVAVDDSLSVRLAQAPDSDGARPFEAELAGRLENWIRRARFAAPNLTKQDTLNLTGALQAKARGRFDARGGAVDELRVNVPDLGVSDASESARLRNESVALTAQAQWNRETGVVQSEQIELVSSFLSARARGVRFDPRSVEAVRGEAAFRADVGRVFALVAAEPGRSASGQATGTLNLRSESGGLLVDGVIDGEALRIVDRPPGAAPRVVWNEPRLRADLKLRIASSNRGGPGLEVREARVASTMINGSVQGRVGDLATLGGVRLEGGIDYDLQQLTPLFGPRLRGAIQLKGKDRMTFRLQSDQSIETLRGRIEAPWEGANLFGLIVGPGRLAVTIEDGVARTEPLSFEAGGGRLTTQATARLAPPPSELSLAPGMLVSDVAFSREVTERVLKFIAPVLADATRIDGRFSLGLEEFSVPLDPPPAGRPGGIGAGRARGILSIHRVDVTPGPSVAEWVAMAQQLGLAARDGVQGVIQPTDVRLLTIDQQDIDFQLADGRVYHRGLRFAIGDVLVDSEGSVGVDESLDLLVSVPVLDDWVESRPLLRGLRGQVLRVPVRGTLSQPKVDQEAFRRHSSGLLQSAAAGAIDTGLNLLFERLRERQSRGGR